MISLLRNTGVKRKELAVWGVVCTLLVLFIVLFTFILLEVAYKSHVQLVTSRAYDSLKQLHYIAQHTSPSRWQDYVQSVYPRQDDSFRYMLVMDATGKALAHSDPDRTGMTFWEPGIQSVVETREPVEQTYYRDADNPDSPFHNERTIDIMAPVVNEHDELIGVVNVGLAYKVVDQLYGQYLVIASFAGGVWLCFGGVFVAFRLRHLRERTKIEHERAKLQSLLNNIVNSMPSALVAVDASQRVLEWSRGAEQATGLGHEQAIGKNLLEVYPQLSNEQQHIAKALTNRAPVAGGRLKRMEGDELRLDDVTIYPLITNGVEGAVIRIDDITEKERVDQVLIQTEKMMSIGGLAAGMAHELSNPLSVIVGGTQLLRGRIFKDSKRNIKVAEQCNISLENMREYIRMRGVEDLLDGIGESGARAARIIKNMLQFSRKHDEACEESHNLVTLLEDALEFARSDFSLWNNVDIRSLEIERDYQEGSPLVICDPGQIQQVLLNIIRNGIEAMKDKTFVEHPPRFVFRVTADEQWVCLEIEDNGPGMDETTRKRVFDPFYTTKPVGVGTGLGLSVSHFIIVEQHHGAIKVDSALGEWTRFSIKLPAGKVC